MDSWTAGAVYLDGWIRFQIVFLGVCVLGRLRLIQSVNSIENEIMGSLTAVNQCSWSTPFKAPWIHHDRLRDCC